MENERPKLKKLPIWRFWLPLFFQSVLILTVPAQAVYTYLSGKTVILQTVPVDPYDLLRGYSQTLRYDISNRENLKKLAGWKDLVAPNEGDRRESLPIGTRFYVILQAPNQSSPDTNPPQAWKPVAVSPDLPSQLPSDRVALQGEYHYGWVDYGLETYYLPEDRIEEINRFIEQTFRDSRQERPFVVEAKIDSRGKAVPVSLWIGDRNYRF